MKQIMQMDTITIKSVVDKFKISLASANNYLTEHITCGRLEKVGRGNSAEYIKK
jgi:Fic family protein